MPCPLLRLNRLFFKFPGPYQPFVLCDVQERCLCSYDSFQEEFQIGTR